jgi:hypothetical protein
MSKQITVEIEPKLFSDDRQKDEECQGRRSEPADKDSFYAQPELEKQHYIQQDVRDNVENLDGCKQLRSILKSQRGEWNKTNCIEEENPSSVSDEDSVAASNSYEVCDGSRKKMEEG